MSNLLSETIQCLEEEGYSPAEVLWVGTEDEWMPWESFERLANFEYDHGFGIAIINAGLLVVGKDWWLERHEYDGSEWWEFKKYPERSVLRNDNLRVNQKD